MNGIPYLVQRESLELEDFRRTGRLPEGQRSSVPHIDTDVGRQFHHFDSGLADVDVLSGSRHHHFHHVDSGLADMDLAGVGGHENLSRIHELHDDDDCNLAPAPRGETDDTKIKHDDREMSDGNS
ncbi:MAG: hypothetical protein Q9205_007664, partial [Flavoplaca limonia]